MLIICCGMPRSGSTLQYQLAVSLLCTSGSGNNLGWVKHAICSELDQEKAQNSFKVVKVHRFNQLEGGKSAIKEGWAICIYVYRDIRDVAVSLMFKNQIDFYKLASSRELSGILEDHHAWTSMDNILISRYEEMVRDPSKEVIRIAKHLGIRISNQKAQTIANEYSLEKQQQRIQEFVSLANNNGTTFEYDSKTLLHNYHIQSGASRQWKNKLNPLQIGYIENLAYNWLLEYRYKISQPAYIRWASRMILTPMYEPQNKIGFLLNRIRNLYERVTTDFSHNIN